MSDFLNGQEEKALAGSLQKIIDHDYWFPDAVFRLFHRVVSRFAIELVIVRDKKVLLAKYHGKDAPEFEGMWHLPGGYDRADEDFSETASRVAKRELGADVRFVKILGIYKWAKGEHPWGGRPISAFAIVEPKGPLPENDEMSFFPLSALPEGMLQCHRRFLLSDGMSGQ